MSSSSSVARGMEDLLSDGPDASSFHRQKRQKIDAISGNKKGKEKRED